MDFYFYFYFSLFSLNRVHWRRSARFVASAETNLSFSFPPTPSNHLPLKKNQENELKRKKNNKIHFGSQFSIVENKKQKQKRKNHCKCFICSNNSNVVWFFVCLVCWIAVHGCVHRRKHWNYRWPKSIELWLPLLPKLNKHRHTTIEWSANVALHIKNLKKGITITNNL